jgi:hypothetical protein
LLPIIIFAIAGIQTGLNDFEQGHFSSFEDFIAKQNEQHSLTRVNIYTLDTVFCNVSMLSGLYRCKDENNNRQQS